MSQMAAFATDVLPDIYGFHSYTWNSAILSHTLVCQFWGQFHGWAVGFHPQLNIQPTCALRPVIPINACTLRITAAAGTELAGASSEGNVIFSSPPKVLYNPKAFFTHAAWLHQSFLHCAIFPTAASRRSLGRVSVPMWLIILSDQLEIVA